MVLEVVVAAAAAVAAAESTVLAYLAAYERRPAAPGDEPLCRCFQMEAHCPEGRSGSGGASEWVVVER